MGGVIAGALAGKLIKIITIICPQS
jgi:hypothetical protein